MPLYSYGNWGGKQSYLQRRNFSDDPNHVNLGIILSKFGAVAVDTRLLQSGFNFQIKTWNMNVFHMKQLCNNYLNNYYQG